MWWSADTLAAMRWRWVLLVRAVGALAFGVLAVVLPGVAQAHTELDYTLPAADEVVAEPVAAITLAFNDPVTVVGAGFEVFTPDERVVQPAFTTDDDRVFVLLLDPPLAGGAVGVRYEVAAEDGHVIDGAFSFTVTATPPTTGAVTAAPTVPPATEPEAPATTAQSGAAPTTPTTVAATAAPPPTSTDPAVIAPAPDDDGDDGNGGSTGLIVGIAIAAALGVGALVVLRSRSSRAP